MREEDRDAFVNGRKSLADIAGESPRAQRSHWTEASYLVMNLPRSDSAALARRAAFRILDDETHRAHAMEIVPRSTKVYLEEEGRIREVERQPEDEE